MEFLQHFQTFINIAVVVAGAVWMVGKINTTTAQLSANVKSLSKSIDGLHDWLKDLDNQVSSNSQKIIRLETLNNINHRGGE